MEVLLSLESCLDEAPPLGSERIGEMTSESVKLEPFKILEAKFIMVALDKNTLKARKVPSLKVETELEKYYFSQGSSNIVKKNLSRSISLEKIPPSIEEMIQIHNLYLQYIQYLDPSFNKKKPDNVVWMKDTIQRSLVLCMPQDRNVHNKIFGGYLMRLAFELAYSTGYIFAKSRISFVALDDIIFKQPVSIGSLLSLTSQVTYSAASTRCFQVKVKADVIDPLTGQQATTNTFHFTFEAHTEQHYQVMPRSYDETMRFIEGQRKQSQSLRSQGLLISQP
jgi:acyl-coenzyme A thioesterase 9